MMNHGKSRFKEFKKYLTTLRQRKKLEINKPFHAAHDKVFSRIKCTDCGNCCRVLGPRFNRPDIERIAVFLGMKPATFAKTYLTKDEDEDIVLLELPCPFLEDDNTCRIYEVRPRACSEYPHTNDKNMHKNIPITIKNLLICPAVPEIIDELMKELKL
ncbi:MAG: YkgJ family cysteine cluster protein [Spirochaetes bacterium]|nr:YkgJ family cysteine cluster protein [Spirochaetota bacterium]